MAQKKALEDKCMAEFNVSIHELPDLITKMEDEGAAILDNAEITLGLKIGILKPMPQVESPSSQTIVLPSNQTQTVVMPTLKTVKTESRDDDGLMP